MIQSRIALVGFKEQAAKATLQTTPAYEIGVNSGVLAGIDITEEDLPITWSSRMVQAHDRTSALPTVQFETLAMPQSVGALLKGAIGQDTISGAGPYDHLFEPVVAMPYYTFFASRDTEHYVIGDARISELAFTWEKTGALKVSATASGCTYEWDASDPTADATEQPQAGVLKGCGGSFQIAGANAVVTGGTITIANNVEPVFGSDDVLPADVFPAMHTVDVSLTIVPDNLDEFQRAATGTPAGAAVTCVPTYTTVDLTWQVGESANTQLVFDADRMKSMVAFPDVTATGGPVELTVEGSIAEAAAGTTYDFTLTNDITPGY